MTPMATPPWQRWLEDYAVGEVFEFGEHLVTEQEILEFARRYDPQPFHLDPEAARSSLFGGLVLLQALNQDGQTVMSLEGRSMHRCRP